MFLNRSSSPALAAGLAFCLTLIFLAPSALSGAVLPGTLGGEISVDNKGAANYSIPLHTPPGRKGIQPSLSLDYSSQGGNGIMGIGWSLGHGYPQSITRGRTILARDGVVDGPDYDSNDKFYLDGKRLIVISGTYGAPGSEYRTEVESFSKIKSFGSQSNIEGFTVETKDGLILRFGKHAGTIDAYQQGGDETQGLAFAYALKRAEDLQGNFMTLTYASNGQGGHVVASISYTGNQAASLSTFATVRFLYNINVVPGNAAGNTERRDKRTEFIAMRRFAHDQRLDRVEVDFAKSSGTETLLRYDLEYEYAPNFGPTRLVTVKPYSRHSQAAGFDNLPPTVFTWSNSQVSYSTPPPLDPLYGTRAEYEDPEMPEHYAFGDVNGDGKDDWVTFGSAISVKLSNGSVFSAATWPTPSINANMWKLWDVNGDGRKDILAGRVDYQSGQCRLYCLISTGTSFVPLGGGSSATEVYSGFGDFKGLNSNGTAASEATFANYRTENGGGLTNRIATGDFTGDGRDDIIIHRMDGKLKILANQGSTSFASNVYDIGAEPVYASTMYNGWFPNIQIEGVRFVTVGVSMMPCELNGDGITDYAWSETFDNVSTSSGFFGASSTRRYLAVTSLPSGGFSAPRSITSNGWNIEHFAPSGGWMYRASSYVVMPGDVNGDGLTDFTILIPDAAVDVPNQPGYYQFLLRHWVYLSKGSSGLPDFEFQEPVQPSPVTVGASQTLPWFDKIEFSTWKDGYTSPALESSNDDVRKTVNVLGSSSGDGIAMCDVNLDGRQDYVWYVAASPNHGWWVMYSLDSGVSPPQPAPLGWLAPEMIENSWTDYAGVNRSSRTSLDMNGDGIPDYAYATHSVKKSPGVAGFHISTGTRGNQLTNVTNGFGRETEIAYRPISDSSVYAKGSGAVYPIRDDIDGRQVVYYVRKDTGGVDPIFLNHLTNQYYYSYAGARTDLSGRGFLGYQAFATLDYNTKLLSYQFTTQSFPMTGLVKREEVYAWENNFSGSDYFSYVSRTVNEVTCDEVKDAAGARLGTLYPMINASRVRKWEMAENASSSYDFVSSEAAPWVVQSASGTAPSRLFSDVVAYTWFDDVPQGTLPPSAPPSIFADDEGQGGVQGPDGSGVRGGFRPTGGAVQGSFHLPEKLGTSTFPALIRFGNMVKSQTDNGDGNKTTTTNTYHPTSYFTGAYLPGKLKDTQTISVTDTGDSTYDAASPVSRYAYFQSGSKVGLLSTETRDASEDALDLVTTYDYSTEGLPDTVQVSGYDSPGQRRHVGSYAVSDVTAYDTHRRWPRTVFDAYGRWTRTDREDLYGQPWQVHDTNRYFASRAIETAYDAFGRVTEVNDKLMGNKTTTLRGFTTGSGYAASQLASPPPGMVGIYAPSAYYERVEADNQPPVTTYYDFLGRQIRSVKEGYGALKATTDTIRDRLDRVVAVSTAYAGTSDKLWTKTYYDDLGRVNLVVAPSGTETRTTFHGRVTQVTVDAPLLGGVDPAPQVNTTLADSRGNVIKVWNADNVPTLSSYTGAGMSDESLRYDLDGAGRMRVTDLKDTTLSVLVAYDAVGNQISLTDPDKGYWEYEYNGRGELVWQKNAKGDQTVIAYDQVGRKISTTIDEGGNGSLEQRSSWHYYEESAQATTNAVVGASGAWIGALQRSEIDVSPFGSPERASSIAYNDQGQERLSLHHVDGKYYYVYTDYDAERRPHRRNYFWRPSGYENDYATQPQLWQKYGLEYTYDAKSYVTKVADSQGRTWWQAAASGAYDAYDAPVKYRKGLNDTVGWTTRTYNPADRALTSIVTGNASANGSYVQNWTYQWDGLGNLTRRTSSLQGAGSGTTYETFGYDPLNRLVARNRNAAPTTVVASYSTTGNILSKTDVGAAASGAYAYGSSKPHAATGAWGYAIGYDANGNMSSRSKAGQTWHFSWTAFDKPKIIAAGPKGSAFLYDAENRRVVHERFDAIAGGVPTHLKSKKIYVGSQMEVDFENVAPTGAADFEMSRARIYIDAPDGRAGAYEFDPRQPASTSRQAYLYHQDHLGSVDAITKYENASSGAPSYAHDGEAKDSLFSYDPWGQRRDPLDWSGPPAATSGSNPDATLTPRGFTDHEMLDDLGLVHMNGRIYDPLLGRFLSADAIVDGVYTLQGYNRYSYVHNNPLSKIDPTGYNWEAAAVSLNIDPAGTGEKIQEVRPLSPTGAGIGAGIERTLLSAVANFMEAMQGDFSGAHPAVHENIANWVDERYEARGVDTSSGAYQNAAEITEVVVIIATASVSHRAGEGNRVQSNDIETPNPSRTGDLDPQRPATETTTHGNPQVTSPGHAETSIDVNNNMVESGEYVSTHQNRSIKSITDGDVDDLRRPDIAGVRQDGTIDVVEIPSKTQSSESQKAKADSMLQSLGDRAGEGHVVEIDETLIK